MKKHRLYATIGVVAASILIVAFMPLPYHIGCSLEIQPRDAQWVYAVVPGRMDEKIVKPGDVVSKDMTLCRLTNEDLEREVLDLQGKAAVARVRLLNLEEQRSVEPKAGAEVRPAMENLTTIQNLLNEKQEKLSRLEIRAAKPGTVIPPPPKSNDRLPPGQLAPWSGSPFDAKNAGAHFADGDLICLIGDPQEMEAVLVVDQADIDLVRVGDRLRVKLDAFPLSTLESKVEKIANKDLEASPVSLSIQGGGTLDTRTDSTGAQRPLNPSYQVRSGVLNQDTVQLQMGLRGQGKIAVEWKSLGYRLYRFVIRTFHFNF